MRTSTRHELAVRPVNAMVREYRQIWFDHVERVDPSRIHHESAKYMPTSHGFSRIPRMERVPNDDVLRRVGEKKMLIRSIGERRCNGGCLLYTSSTSAYLMNKSNNKLFLEAN